MQNVRPFRFWCQKVLPLVYDDSLSYYELLCKVVKYLNDVINSLNQNNEAVSELAKMLEELRQYVDDYFENIDLQEEIDNKLDEMAQDGTLAEIINQEVFGEIKAVTDGIEKTKNGIMTVFNPSCAGLMETARTYVNHSDEFIYGGPSFLTTVKEGNSVIQMRKVPIEYINGSFRYRASCSTLVLAALNGIEYSQSRIVSGHSGEDEDSVTGYALTGGSNKPTSGSYLIDNYDADILSYAEEGEWFIYASSLAHMLSDKGMLHKVNVNRINKLCVGDILFYRDANVAPDKWENIVHCEIFCGVANQGYVVYTAQASGDTFTMKTRRYTDDYPANRLAYFGRLPLPNNPITGIDMLSEVVSPFTINSGNPTAKFTFSHSKKTVSYRPYIFTIHVGNISGTNSDIRVGLEDSTDGTLHGTTIVDVNDKNHWIGHGCYYGVIYNTDGVACDKLRVWCGGTGTECRIIDIALLEYAGFPKMV